MPMTFIPRSEYSDEEIEKKFEKELKDSMAERTYKEYLRYHKLFGGVKELSKPNVNEFLNLRNNPVARSYIKYALEFCKKYDYLFNQEFLNKIALIYVPKIKYIKKNETSFITEEEMKLIKDKFSDTREKAFVVCCFYTGLRRAECFNITPNDFNFKEWYQNGGKDAKAMGILTVPSSIAKRNKQRIVSVHPKAMFFLGNYVNYRMQKEKKFGTESRMFDFSSSKFSVKLREIALKKIKKHVTIHTLRHSFGTMLVENNIPIEQIRLLMGHSDISTTQIYLHLRFNQINKTMEDKFLKETLN